MELKDVINERRSIRGFTDKPVAKETLQEVLRLATRAISGKNSQPWEFAVVTGPVLDELRARNVESLRSGAPTDLPDWQLSGVYLERSRTIGKALLGAMGIPREDKEGRVWWWERGYRFFDAPAAIFVLVDEELKDINYNFDMGCVVQNICLAAVEYGLGTCVEYQGVTYQKAARELLGIPENKIFVVSIAIGYPDPDFPANGVISPREEVDTLTTWHGFA